MIFVWLGFLSKTAATRLPPSAILLYAAHLGWWWVPWLWRKGMTKLFTFFASRCDGHQSPILKLWKTTISCSARKHWEKWFRRNERSIFECAKSSGNVICVSFWTSFYCGCVVGKDMWVYKSACRSHLISCLSNFDGKRRLMLTEFAGYWSICGAHWSGLTVTRARYGASRCVVFGREDVFSTCLGPCSCSVPLERWNWNWAVKPFVNEKHWIRNQ